MITIWLESNNNKMLRKLKKLLRKDINLLIYFVTTKCPLRCSHCFYNKELNANIHELTLEEVKKIINKLPNLDSVQISGGEPFTRKDLPQIVSAFAECGVKHIGIPTNGFLTEKVIAAAKEIKEMKLPVSITISLDGFEETHNKIRGVNCWKRALDTFEKLKKLGIRTGFCFSLSKANYAEAVAFLKFLQSKEPDYIAVNLVRAKPSIMISAEEFEAIRPEIEKIVGKYLSKSYRRRGKMLNDVYHTSLKDNNCPSFRCLAGKVMAVLEPDGQVRSCELRPKIANVRDYGYDLKKVLALEKPLMTPCKGCIHSCFLGPSMSHAIVYQLKHLHKYR